MSVLNTETVPERNGMLAPTVADEVSSVQLANSFLRTALDQTTEGIMVVEPSLAHHLGPRILLHNTRMAALVGAEPRQGLRDRFLTQLVGTSDEANDLLRAIRTAITQGGATQWEGGLKTLYGQGRQRCTWRIRAVMDEHARVYNYTLAVVPTRQNAATTNAVSLALAPDDPRRLRNDNIAELTPGILHDINHILAIMTTNLSAAI
ncbi:MAG: hypothetical protein ACOYMN_19345, partial [Roseimicrobium sp.]